MSSEISEAYYQRYRNIKPVELIVSIEITLIQCETMGCSKYEYNNAMEAKTRMQSECNKLKIEILEKYGELPAWFDDCPFDHK